MDTNLIAEIVAEKIKEIMEEYSATYGVDKIVVKASTYFSPVNKEIEVHISVEVKEEYDNGKVGQ